MPTDTDFLTRSLESFPPMLRAAVAGLTAEQARSRGPQGQWSIIEIVAHLADEETEDFRARVLLTLDDPESPWPGIDPEGAAAERGYIERDLGEELEGFERVRAESIAMLHGLIKPDWSKVHSHPSIGALSAADLLTSWAAHDLLHLRQIAKRRFELVAKAGTDTRYAGSWS